MTILTHLIQMHLFDCVSAVYHATSQEFRTSVRCLTQALSWGSLSSIDHQVFLPSFFQSQ